jgi:hypothetical protein
MKRHLKLLFYRNRLRHVNGRALIAAGLYCLQLLIELSMYQPRLTGLAGHRRDDASVALGTAFFVVIPPIHLTFTISG